MQWLNEENKVVETHLSKLELSKAQKLHHICAIDTWQLVFFQLFEMLFWFFFFAIPWQKAFDALQTLFSDYITVVPKTSKKYIFEMR